MANAEPQELGSERRNFERRPVHAAVSIDATERANRVGVTRNLSAGGVLFHTASLFSVGESLDLTFRGPPVVPVDTRVGGRVVRSWSDPNRTESLFPHVVAVEFVEPIGYLQT